MGSYKHAKSASEFLTQRLDMDGDCWEYQGCLSQKGYGQTSPNTILDTELGEVTAHRASYRLWVGPIPEGMFVCHTCDNRKCCRPSHLFLGTNADNMADKKLKGRALGRAGRPRKGRELPADTIAMLRGYVPAGRLAKLFSVTPVAIYYIWKKAGSQHAY